MQRKIIRVFPHKNSYTPTDDYAFYGEPQGLFPLPEHDEIHISCTFTWDKAYCEHLAFQYEVLTNKPVKLGGVMILIPLNWIKNYLNILLLKSVYSFYQTLTVHITNVTIV